MFGAGAGLLCGTVGFAAEYGWSQLAMPLPWTDALLPEGLIYAAVAGVAGGLLGALFAAALRGELPRPRVARIACIGAFALLAAVAIGAADEDVPDARAQIELTDVKPRARPRGARDRSPRPAGHCRRRELVLHPRLGGRRRPRDRPARAHRARRLPLDEADPAGRPVEGRPAAEPRPRTRRRRRCACPWTAASPNAEQTLPAVATAEQLERAMRESSGAELPAPASFDRPFGDDNLIVLRETKGDVAGWLWALGIGLTALIWGLCIAGLVLGLGRMARRSRHASRPRAGLMTPDHEVAIIGAGLSGLGMAAALRRAGIEDFVILERADDVGGTWRDNTYPGIGVDIPTFAYQFSYELKPDWSRVFAKGSR